ncbi:MAG: hypothetical protein JWQ98_2903 [Chlorobi bacterium]|nr:hypothetical protein [Chlorobiota bacterium]
MSPGIFWFRCALGGLMVIMGILILAGYFTFPGDGRMDTSMLRTVFGIIMILFGIYRLAVTFTQRRRGERE